MPCRTKIPKMLACQTLFICLMLFISPLIGRAEQASATLGRDGDKLILKLSLPSPPPVNLIAQITVPPGVKIVSTSPQAAKVDRKKSQIKWLVKNPRPGAAQFSVTTSPGADPASASAVVLYRNPGDGSMVKIRAAAN